MVETQTKNIQRYFSIFIIGNSGVGKTCFINNFCSRPFIENHKVTPGIDYVSKVYSKNDESYIMRLFDSNGNRFNSITKQYLNYANGIIFVYSIDDVNSFNSIIEWIEFCKTSNISSTTGMLIVGNKSDLVENRKVTFEEGEKLSKQLGIRFFEVSSKTGENVQEAFEYLFDETIFLFSFYPFRKFFLRKRRISKNNQNKCQS